MDLELGGTEGSLLCQHSLKCRENSHPAYTRNRNESLPNSKEEKYAQTQLAIISVIQGSFSHAK